MLSDQSAQERKTRTLSQEERDVEENELKALRENDDMEFLFSKIDF